MLNYEMSILQFYFVLYLFDNKSALSLIFMHVFLFFCFSLMKHYTPYNLTSFPSINYKHGFKDSSTNNLSHTSSFKSSSSMRGFVDCGYNSFATYSERYSTSHYKIDSGQTIPLSNSAANSNNSDSGVRWITPIPRALRNTSHVVSEISKQNNFAYRLNQSMSITNLLMEAIDETSLSKDQTIKRSKQLKTRNYNKRKTNKNVNRISLIKCQKSLAISVSKSIKSKRKTKKKCVYISNLCLYCLKKYILLCKCCNITIVRFKIEDGECSPAVHISHTVQNTPTYQIMYSVPASPCSKTYAQITPMGSPMARTKQIAPIQITPMGSPMNKNTYGRGININRSGSNNLIQQSSTDIAYSPAVQIGFRKSSNLTLCVTSAQSEYTVKSKNQKNNYNSFKNNQKPKLKQMSTLKKPQAHQHYHQQHRKNNSHQTQLLRRSTAPLQSNDTSTPDTKVCISTADNTLVSVPLDFVSNVDAYKIWSGCCPSENSKTIAYQNLFPCLCRLWTRITNCKQLPTFAGLERVFTRHGASTQTEDGCNISYMDRKRFIKFFEWFHDCCSIVCYIQHRWSNKSKNKNRKGNHIEDNSIMFDWFCSCETSEKLLKTAPEGILHFIHAYFCILVQYLYAVCTIFIIGTFVLRLSASLPAVVISYRESIYSRLPCDSRKFIHLILEHCKQDKVQQIKNNNVLNSSPRNSSINCNQQPKQQHNKNGNINKLQFLLHNTNPRKLVTLHAFIRAFLHLKYVYTPTQLYSKEILF